MIYANVQNALNTFGQGDVNDIVSILETVYNGAENVTVANTTVTWNYNDLQNGTFLHNLTDQQSAVLLFDVVQRIFMSYNLHVPHEYTDLLEHVADGSVPPTQDVEEALLTVLAFRFYVSAVYYVVACVRSSYRRSNFREVS